MHAILLVALLTPTVPSEDAPRFHLDARSRARIDAALERGARWLSQRQTEAGAFRSTSSTGVPELPLTAMALWALAASSNEETCPKPCALATSWLVSRQQPDGGVYEPRSGLVRFTSAIVRQALATRVARWKDTVASTSLDQLNLFVYRNAEVESIEEARSPSHPGAIAQRVEKLLERDDLDDATEKALRFLAQAEEKPTDRRARWSAPETAASAEPVVSYDELLRSIGELASTDNPTLWRTHRALRAHYTLAGNPDLTRRYGPDGFQNRNAGLYYYYVNVARTLGGVGRPTLKTDDGADHDWTRELSDRLLVLQDEDGFWVNDNGRWWEDDPVLVTCYAMLALSICRDLEVSK